MNIHVKAIPMPQRMALYYIQRYECEGFGVIVKSITGRTLVSKGLATEAPRRPYARAGGICLRLTDAGRAAIAKIEGDA